MKFVRGLLLACVAICGTIGPAGVVSQATAHENPHHGHHQHAVRVFYVYYRDCPQNEWTCYGGYYSYVEAATAVIYFEANGYQAFLN